MNNQNARKGATLAHASALLGKKMSAIAIKQIRLVPLAGIEPALLAEPDFESGASTNSAKGANPKRVDWYAADYTNRGSLVNLFLPKIAFHETLFAGLRRDNSRD